MIEQLTSAMKAAMTSLDIAYTKHQDATVHRLYLGHAGRHTGIYIVYGPNKTYYIGIATESNTIYGRFQPHYAKFTVNLSAMYGGTDKDKKETRWQFPKNWRKGIKQEFLLNEDNIPNYWIGKQKKEVIKPSNLDWKPVFKEGVDIDNISVAVWDLGHLTPKQIDILETALVQDLKPLFNGAKTKKKNG
jgi:hypothetical protein